LDQHAPSIKEYFEGEFESKSTTDFEVAEFSPSKTHKSLSKT